MRLFTIISAGLVVAAASAQAQSPAPRGMHDTATSDLSGPYAEMLPAGGPGYGHAPNGDGPNSYGPRLLPPPEVYTVLRDHGFSARGIPRKHGFFYTVPVTDRRGDNGRLVIDARNGRIARFVPAYRWGAGFGAGLAYGPSWRMPPMGPAPRPPAPVPVPKLASRTPPSAVPLPKPDPVHPGDAKPQVNPEVKPLAEQPTPERQQSAAYQAKPAEAAPEQPHPAPAPVEAKPATPPQPDILPTQEMPKVQGFE